MDERAGAEHEDQGGGGQGGRGSRVYQRRRESPTQTGFREETKHRFWILI